MKTDSKILVVQLQKRIDYDVVVPAVDNNGDVGVPNDLAHPGALPLHHLPPAHSQPQVILNPFYGTTLGKKGPPLLFQVAKVQNDKV